MAEYIDREAAIAYAPLPKHFRKYKTMNLDDAWEDGYDFAIRQIESIPAADVRPVVRGKWVDVRYDDEELVGGWYTIPKCSVCKEEAPYKSNFCPNCGAMMEES